MLTKIYSVYSLVGDTCTFKDTLPGLLSQGLVSVTRVLTKIHCLDYLVGESCRGHVYLQKYIPLITLSGTRVGDSCTYKGTFPGLLQIQPQDMS